MRLHHGALATSFPGRGNRVNIMANNPFIYMEQRLVSTWIKQVLTLFRTIITGTITSGGGTYFILGGLKFPPPVATFFSDINQKIFPDIYKEGPEKKFSGNHNKKIFQTYNKNIFRTKKQNIANFPLIRKFSKNTPKFFLYLIIKIFPEKTKCFGGLKPPFSPPTFTSGGGLKPPCSAATDYN